MLRSLGGFGRVDVLVVGGGIAGLQSALDLADQGLKVLICERRRASAAT